MYMSSPVFSLIRAFLISALTAIQLAVECICFQLSGNKKAVC